MVRELRSGSPPRPPRLANSPRPLVWTVQNAHEPHVHCLYGALIWHACHMASNPWHSLWMFHIHALLCQSQSVCVEGACVSDGGFGLAGESVMGNGLPLIDCYS